MSSRLPEQSEYPQGPSVGTIVWGAILAVLAALLAVGRLGWIVIDPRYTVVTLLVLAGLGLLVGGGLASIRGRRPYGEDRNEPKSPYESGRDAG
jgi:hypothetical protein